MSLGDAFPAELKSAAIKRQLKPGAIIKQETMMDDGEIHEKRFVVLSVDEATFTFTCVINSIISRIIANDPIALKCQVEIDQRTHPFMAWNSHIDCSRLRIYSTDDICKQLENKPGWVLGEITADMRDDIVCALKFSRTIAPDKFEVCCKALAEIS